MARNKGWSLTDFTIATFALSALFTVSLNFFGSNNDRILLAIGAPCLLSGLGIWLLLVLTTDAEPAKHAWMFMLPMAMIFGASAGIGLAQFLGN